MFRVRRACHLRNGQLDGASETDEAKSRACLCNRPVAMRVPLAIFLGVFRVLARTPSTTFSEVYIVYVTWGRGCPKIPSRSAQDQLYVDRVLGQFCQKE